LELDKRLIKQIKLNLKLNKISASRYRIIQGDAIKKLKGQYDFILANPPYLAVKRKSQVQASVLRHEPAQALFAGANGLFYIKKILELIKFRLQPKGQLWLEFDSFQKKSIENLLKKLKYQKWNFYRDQYQRWRYVQVFQGG
jgi:release factor glutamine methyltransferase